MERQAYSKEGLQDSAASCSGLCWSHLQLFFRLLGAASEVSLSVPVLILPRHAQGHQGQLRAKDP